MLARLVSLVLLLVSIPAAAQNAVKLNANVPESLQPWVGWVLHGHETETCPLVHGSDGRQCPWPASLRLDLEEQGGRFLQQWFVDVPLWVPLPGDVRVWPQEVRVDGKDAVVVSRDELPHVYLESGKHAVSGSFVWDSLPQTLPVSNAVALLSLTVRGLANPFPERDDGRVWLQRQSAPQEQDLLEVSVQRRILDDIPLQMTTRIELKVSGAPREVLLGRPLLEGFVPMMLQSPLPVRLEADGHLRAQVRPGSWIIYVVSRHQGPVSELRFADQDGLWDEQEIWVFEARKDLRIVTIEGVSAVDPQQTELPDDWREFPAYLLQVGDSMHFDEQQRGNADPAPDALILARTYWLDFDGTGYTVRDKLSGTMSRDWRLTMNPPATLGRVLLGGAAQLITESPAGGAGVEVRQAQLDIEAESRVERRAGILSAVGWDHDVQGLSAELHLGPGWRLLHATGVDVAAPTWVGTWTLFDLFVVLLVAVTFRRLWGNLWGVMALAAVGLSYIEPGAPSMVWVPVLISEALVRVLPENRWTPGVRLGRVAACALLVFVTVPFMVQQARQALHPALADGFEVTQALPKEMRDYDAASPVEGEEGLVKGLDAPVSGGRSKYVSKADPNANVQTGPGVPAWQWQTVSLSWSGPVAASQDIHLILIPPWLNRLIEVLRVLLLAVLLFCVIRGLRLPTAGAAARVVAGFSLLLLPLVARAEIPPADILDQLRQRLLEAPTCAPTCAASPGLLVDADATRLRLRQRVDAATTVAVPLPGGANQWVAQEVLVDGEAATALRRDDGLLWVRLTAGRHEIVVQGALAARDEVQLHLPLLPHRVRATVQGWSLQGVHEDGIADADIVLTRIRKDEEKATGILEANTLPPFLQLTRTIHLGLTWDVVTSIRRQTPPGAAVVVELPLLPAEAVTTANLRVVDGKAIVSLAAGENAREWRSVLPQAASMKLVAGASASWSEVWQVDASPLWHVEASGIPTVLDLEAGADRLSTWRPWPGEVVDLVITRPSAVVGNTTTIDSSQIVITPAQRATDVNLYLSIRSGRGGDHVLTLPDGAELQTVTINGTAQPLRQDGRKLTLPLTPGAQQVHILLRQSQPMSAHFESPPIDVGTASVNATILLNMPENRWTLFTRGPLLRPAVLFWGVLAIFLMASLALGRLPLTPLASYDWFLLSVGLTQAPVEVAGIVVGWLLLLGWRREHGAAQSSTTFNALQVVLVGATLAALAGLLASIQRGLLGLPEMQIAGNGSSAYQLRWFQDICGPLLPQVTVLSVPLFVYRLTMLLWALWLARSLLTWLRWGWDSFSSGGLWRPRQRRVQPVAAAKDA